jgi:hypothetical protein
MSFSALSICIDIASRPGDLGYFEVSSMASLKEAKTRGFASLPFDKFAIIRVASEGVDAHLNG